MTEVERYQQALGFCRQQRNAAQDALIDLGVEIASLKAQLEAALKARDVPNAG
jgi:hypothetical protein